MRTDYRDGERIRSVELTPEGAGAWRVSTFATAREILRPNGLRMTPPQG